MLIKGKFGKRAKGKCRRFKTSKELKWKKNHNYTYNKKKYQRSGWDKCKEERKNGRKKKTEKKRNKRE